MPEKRWARANQNTDHNTRMINKSPEKLHTYGIAELGRQTSPQARWSR